ncbi:MAG: pullulanase-type alpha-1,6-glucosidase [Bdellovibrionota bacterium]
MARFFWAILILPLALAGSAKAGSPSIFPLSIYGARAAWISKDELIYTPRSRIGVQDLRFEAMQMETGQRWPFSLSGSRSDSVRLRFSPPTSMASWVREPTMLVVSDSGGQELDRTYFQTGRLLDAIHHYDGCLGVCFEKGAPVLRVWAPTARAVKVLWVSAGKTPVIQSSSELASGEDGTFEIAGDSSWLGRNYLYEVDVFSPVTGKRENFRVTDPYSVGLAVDSASSVLLDLRDSRWKPPGWDLASRPPLASRNDSVLYELHVRDFSAHDFTVPPGLRGTYRAFTLEGTDGDRELRDLAAAGITHLHLLPTFDFSSVEEDPAARREPQIPGGLPTDSPLPQESVNKLRSLDSFNWGYDPFHYLTPEGSYAQSPEGGSRTLEFREMVQALHRKGLRVVLDMVFNHTYAAGLADEAVLDKVVPGYYHRLDGEGQVRNSSCCSDTASERWMMEKLMRDGLELWRSQYGVDGFRFDLMNLHSVGTMERLRDFERAKDPSLLFYGEAWAFGSLLDTDPASAFTQSRVYGTSIGVFNDRIRDALRGGTTDSKGKSDPGFLTGLYYDFNQEPANRDTPMDLGQQRDKLLWLTDVVRVGMAGNLRDFPLTDHRGNQIHGGDLQFNGGPTGFSRDPEESINYVSAHDGYTLWDSLAAKLPFHTRNRAPDTATVEQRVDRQILALGLVALSQGIPFFDEGSELLRSKSGDQNSFDSGDWFNSVNWSGNANNWGVGLPPAFSNPDDWPFWRPRLAEPALNPGAKEIAACRAAFLDLLKLRRSSPLFRLHSGSEIQKRVHFLETELGPMQAPGMIVMEIRNNARDADPNWRRVIIAANAMNDSQVFPHSSLGRSTLVRLFGKGESRLSPTPQLLLPPRSLTVWGEK